MNGQTLTITPQIFGLSEAASKERQNMRKALAAMLAEMSRVSRCLEEGSEQGDIQLVNLACQFEASNDSLVRLEAQLVGLGADSLPRD